MNTAAPKLRPSSVPTSRSGGFPAVFPRRGVRVDKAGANRERHKASSPWSGFPAPFGVVREVSEGVNHEDRL